MTFTELRLLKYRLIITITFLILCSLAASCQITKVNNGFLISREYAEFIAARFDSLEVYKTAYSECINRAVECDYLLNKSESLIADLKKQQSNYSDMILLKDAMIKSYERDAIVYKDLTNQLKKQTRFKKAWKITTYTFITVSLSAITYSIFK